MQHVFLEVQACLLTPPKFFLPGAELMGDELCGSPRGPIPRESEAAAKGEGGKAASSLLWLPLKCKSFQ